MNTSKEDCAIKNMQLQESSRLSFSWSLPQAVSWVPSDSDDVGQQA